MGEEAEEVAALQRAAEAFRRAIERCDKSKLPVTFSSFPSGACGDTTPVLGTYLIACGFRPFDYVLGHQGTQEAGTYKSHAWLERSGLVVDITADQFPEVNSPVIVTCDSAWHKALRGSVEHVADYRVFDGHARRALESAYEVIVREVRGSPERDDHPN